MATKPPTRYVNIPFLEMLMDFEAHLQMEMICPMGDVSLGRLPTPVERNKKHRELFELIIIFNIIWSVGRYKTHPKLHFLGGLFGASQYSPVIKHSNGTMTGLVC